MLVYRHRAASQPQPDDWADQLRVALRSMPGVVLVGAKRLSPDGRVFSMGEFVVHPKGFHHHGKGVIAAAYRFPVEVDAVTGGVFAVDAAAFEAAGGVSILQGSLGALELCLNLRSAGGRCVAVPQVVVLDTHEPVPTPKEHDAFIEHRGFDWRAADLDRVRQQHADTGLLWNVRYHARAMPFEKYVERPAVHWANYQNVEVYRKRADHIAQLVHQLCPSGKVLDLGCGDGLFSHLFALRGAEVTGVDPEPVAIEQARTRTADHAYPGPRPGFVVGSGDELGGLESRSIDLVIMLDVIEHLPNPVAVLREAARVLSPDGSLLVTTPAWQYEAWSDPVYHVTEYSLEELIRQIEAATGLSVVNTGKIGGVYRDLIVVAKNSNALSSVGKL